VPDTQLELYRSLLIKKKLRGLDDLYFFNKYIIEDNRPERQKFLVPHVHGQWASWFASSASRIRLILVPRSTFKTSFFTVGWSLQQIAKNRNVRILIANATLANAQRMVGEIKEHVQKNETFRLLYGDMYDKRLKWNEDELVVKGRDRGIREATVTAVGVGGNLVSQHYDVILADDLVNSENSATRYQADKVIDWWRKSLSLLEPTGTNLIIGTRWSYYELYSYLLDEMNNKVDSYVRGAYNSDGSFYFPERFNEKKLTELKELHGSYIFSSFYLNNPVDVDMALIKKSMIKYYDEAPDNLEIFTCIDPAISQGTSADYTAIVTVGIDWQNNWYVLETRRGKWTVGRMIEEIFSVYKRWQPTTMSIEVIGLAQALLDSIHTEEEKRNQFLPLTEIKARNAVNKERRIRATLQPRFENGKIFIKRDMSDLEDELIHFPKSKHDDLIDSMSDIAEIGFAPGKEEEKEPEPKSKLLRRLQEKFNRKKIYVDPVLGERF